METPVANSSSGKNNRILIIAAVVALFLLCCCLATAGFFFLRSGGGTGPLGAYNGIADARLRTDTMNLIGTYEATIGCDNISLVSGEVTAAPDLSGNGSWTELWVIDACGETHPYSILFTPAADGGTDIQIRVNQ